MSERGGGGGGNRTSHFKLVESDPKYGMLLWQSKLQEKLLQEQKDKKASQEAATRRKSDEEYHTYSVQAANNGMDGSTGTTASRSRSRQDGESREEIRHVPIVMFEDNPSSYSPPRPPALGVTSVDDNLSNTSFAMTNDPREKYAGTTSGNSGGGGPSASTSQTHRTHLNARSYTNENNYANSIREADTERITSPPGVKAETSGGAGFHTNYQKEQPMLPKLVPSKLNSSVSCDNLVTNLHQLYSNPAFFGVSAGGGAGAPRRSPSGKVVTNLQGHPDIRYHQKDSRGFDHSLRCMMDRDKITKYREDLDKQLEEKQRWRRMLGSPNYNGPIKIMSSHDRLDEVQFQDHLPSSSRRESGIVGGVGGDARRLSRNGTELAPLMRKYKSLPKLNALNSTDVTRSFVPSPRRGDAYCLSPEPEEVARGLALQLEEKQRIHQIHQQSEKLATERHFNTWDSFWGRPGHGAPIFYSRNSPIGASTSSLVSPRGGATQFNKTDLFKAIHMTHQFNKPNN